MMELNFLMCSERSGSNLLTRIVNAHSSVCGPAPTHLFRLFLNNIDNYGDLSVALNWRTLVEDFVLNFESKLGVWNIDLTVDSIMSAVPAGSVSELLRYPYEREASYQSVEKVFIKENQAHRFASKLIDCYPTAKFVFMVRDPRDVVSSWILNKSHSGGVKRAVDVWIDDQFGCLEFTEKLVDRKHAFYLKYEDLLCEPESEVAKLMQFLGVQFEPQQLEFYLNQNTLDNASRVEAWANLMQPLMANNSGKYRDTLTPTDIHYIETRCASLIRKFGYRLESKFAYQPELNSHISLDDIERKISASITDSVSDAESEARVRRLAVLETVLKRRM